jgi:hypothetical protein
MGRIPRRRPARSDSSQHSVNLLAAKRNTHACVRCRRAPQGDISENHYSRAYSIPRVITTAGRCAAKHTDDPDVAMNILAMKNFGSTHSNSRRCRAREPPIGQEDHCCATTRSVTIPTVQRLAIPEASPACLVRIAGFDVSL